MDEGRRLDNPDQILLRKFAETYEDDKRIHDHITARDLEKVSSQGHDPYIYIWMVFKQSYRPERISYKPERISGKR